MSVKYIRNRSWGGIQARFSTLIMYSLLEALVTIYLIFSFTSRGVLNGHMIISLHFFGLRFMFGYSPSQYDVKVSL